MVGAHRIRDRSAAAEAERRAQFRVTWRPREREKGAGERGEREGLNGLDLGNKSRTNRAD
jgi:hypothetical protein